MTEMHFDQETHRYMLGDRPMPSVTQVLAETGIIDTRFFTEDARDRGTAVHLATQYLDEGDLDMESVDPAIRPYLDAWELAIDELGIRILEIEKRVWSSTYGYAGTLDRVATINDEKAIIDIKTGGKPGPATALQLAAYAEAYASGHDPDVVGGLRPPVSYRRFAIWLRNDGTYRPIEYTDRSDINVFRAAVAVWNWKESHK